MKECEKNRLLELLVKAHEGGLEPEEARFLNERIKADDEAAALYAEFFATVSNLVDFGDVPLSFEENHSAHLDTWLNLLAEEENAAPVVALPEVREERTPVAKVVYDRAPRRLSKFSVAAAVFSAAALLFMVLLVRLAPDRRDHPVATLTDSLNARWTDANVSLQAGQRLCVDRRPLRLGEGLAEIRFDNNAGVVIEGPAEFQILAEDRIGLHFGRAYARVPQEAIGFSIYTRNAKVIDLGTEFGIESDSRGDTCLHMIDGRTQLIAGEKADRIGIEVVEGTAWRVAADTQVISEMRCEESLFVRAFDSKSNLVWRRRPVFSLADAVGGGNGFGTGTVGAGVNLSNGRRKDDYRGVGRCGTGEYIAVPEIPFVDGVFVPLPDKGPVQVSSLGHRFAECPRTNGEYIGQIRNGGMQKRTLPMILDGQTYGTAERHALLVHPNGGITFDLQAIRRPLSEYETMEFRALAGISSNALQMARAEIFVLVDGRLRQSALLTLESGTVDIGIELTREDRFLTLISTDGGNGLESDWVIFAEPSIFFGEGSPSER